MVVGFKSLIDLIQCRDIEYSRLDVTSRELLENAIKLIQFVKNDYCIKKAE